MAEKASELQILNAVIRQDNEMSWTVRAGAISLRIAFDPISGLTAESLRNLAGCNEREYVSRPFPLSPVSVGDGNWTLLSAEISSQPHGGRETVLLELRIGSLGAELTLHAVAFPAVSVVRYCFTFRNTSLAHAARLSVRPFDARLSLGSLSDTFRIEWVHGGEASHEHGRLYGSVLGRSFAGEAVAFSATASDRYMPMALLVHEQSPHEGLMTAIDYLGPWSFEAKRNAATEKESYVSFCFETDNGRAVTVPPHEALETPSVTLAAFAGNRDALMKELYDWQYLYMWDYTNSDYYAKIRGQGAGWIYCGRNLHEQFCYRLAVMNLRGAAKCKQAGIDILWDDAGWSAYPGAWPPDSYGNVFNNNYDGPDYRISQRYFRRCGLGWLLWFTGKPSRGILENKHGAWGGFEWRTDALSNSDAGEDAAFRRSLREYLDGDTHRSFHTCSGGSNYSHTFDVNRFSNYNYIADLGAGPYNNYYFSYFETPDKWGDLVSAFGAARIAEDGSSFYSPELIDPDTLVYKAEYSHARLSMVPLPCGLDLSGNIAPFRRDIAIYRYLLSEGVAGYGSYMYHPQVFGDAEYYYMQRVSGDSLRSVVILRHTPDRTVTVFPRGLIGEADYSVSFQNSSERFSATGKELTEHGLTLDAPSDGELIYLNLDRHPGASVPSEPPTGLGKVFCRYECNIGTGGTAIYWNALPERQQIEYYEVFRGGEPIACCAVGSSWFDFEAPYSPDTEYQVRAVNIFGQKGPLTKAERLPGDALCLSSLGGHGADMGLFGWTAEYTVNLKDFAPMHWVAPEHTPLADLNGTPNQPGGAEGYWEGGGCARIGRGWMQASPAVYACRRLTLPHDGLVRISGRAMKEWFHQRAGGDVSVSVRLNDKELVPWTSVRTGDAYGAAHDATADVRRGDALRFLVGRSRPESAVMGYEKEACIVGWLPRVTYCEKTTGASGFSMRINCGGGSVTDGCGQQWRADDFCLCGRAETFDSADPLIRSAAVGQRVEYAVPVPDGLYTLRLRFAEPEKRRSGERVFRVTVNGSVREERLDILQYRRGGAGPLDRVYRCIAPDGNGNISVLLEASASEALLQAIEIADERRDAVRINCGGNSFTDWAGNVWEADNCAPDESIRSEKAVLQASPTLYDAALYQTARTGRELSYVLPLREGLYSVQLKFAELWEEDRGKRPADISINGERVRSGFDISSAAGFRDMAFDLRFDDISPVNGAITVRISAAGERPAVIQAIACD